MKITAKVTAALLFIFCSFNLFAQGDPGCPPDCYPGMPLQDAIDIGCPPSCVPVDSGTVLLILTAVAIFAINYYKNLPQKVTAA